MKGILQLLGKRKQTPSLPGTMGEEKNQTISASRKRQKILLPDPRYFWEKGRSKSYLSLGGGQEGISGSHPVPKQSTDLFGEVQKNGLLLNTHHEYKAQFGCHRKGMGKTQISPKNQIPPNWEKKTVKQSRTGILHSIIKMKYAQQNG